MTTSQATRVLARRVSRTNAAPAAPLRLYAIFAGQRPVSGTRMYAHTQAAINVLGITRTKGAPKAAVLHLLGHRALAYHTERLVNMLVRDDKVTLTKAGTEFFAAREKEGKVPTDLVEAFMYVFTTGKASPVAQIKAHQINSTPL